MKRHNHGRRKHGRISRGYLDPFQLPQYQESRYNYPSSESLIPTHNLAIDSRLMKLSAPCEKKLVQVPQVNWDLCEGCGICVQNCPIGAIKIITEKAHINSEICTRCGICAKICPNNAISMLYS